jgi:hypothetical protein
VIGDLINVDAIQSTEKKKNIAREDIQHLSGLTYLLSAGKMEE